VWRSVQSKDREPLSLTVQGKEGGMEQSSSLNREAAISGKWAAILYASGWGSNLTLQEKNLRTVCGRKGAGFIKTWPDSTAM